MQQHLTSRDAGLIEFQHATASSNEFAPEQTRVKLLRLVDVIFSRGRLSGLLVRDEKVHVFYAFLDDEDVSFYLLVKSVSMKIEKRK